MSEPDFESEDDRPAAIGDGGRARRRRIDALCVRRRRHHRGRRRHTRRRPRRAGRRRRARAVAALAADGEPDAEANGHATALAEPPVDTLSAEDTTPVEDTAPVEATAPAEVIAVAEDEVDEDDDDFDDEPPVVESPYDRPGRWFVVHTYAGYENKVKSNLESRIVSMNMEDRIFEVVIPMEDVVEFKNGKKVVVQKKVFPGYLLTRCDLDDDSWSVIRNTPGVTGFVGPGTKPTPLSRREVESILQVKVEGGAEPVKKTRPRLEYEVGETVRVQARAPSPTSRARSTRSTRTS